MQDLLEKKIENDVEATIWGSGPCLIVSQKQRLCTLSLSLKVHEVADCCRGMDKVRNLG